MRKTFFAGVLLLFAIFPQYTFAEATIESFPVTVCYDQTLDEMIAAGRYDWKRSDINAENFSIEGKGKQELTIEVVHFNRIMESDEVLRDLDKHGLRPATLAELLALGAKYPDKQREFSIVALGSLGRIRYSNYVPYLWTDGSVRELDLIWFENRWFKSDRFAAVRK